MENQEEKKLENEMEKGCYRGYIGGNVWKLSPRTEKHIALNMEHEMEARGQGLGFRICSLSTLLRAITGSACG